MKRLISTGFLLTFFIALSAQVTFDKKYDYSTSVVKLESLGYKYYLMDVPNGECKIYNLDHSLYKIINCGVPNGFFLADIKYVSENLFDTDDGLELVCIFYKYNSSQAYYEYNSKIINDNGSAIQTINGAQYIYINKTEENTYKLFAYCFDYSIFPEKVWTNIYSLPGTPVVAIFNNEQAELELNAFPNPASQTVKVAYSLPENVNFGYLHLFDNSGQAVQQFIVDNHTTHLELNISEFKSGVYHYFIEYGNTKTPSKKLVIR